MQSDVYKLKCIVTVYINPQPAFDLWAPQVSDIKLRSKSLETSQNIIKTHVVLLKIQYYITVFIVQLLVTHIFL